MLVKISKKLRYEYELDISQDELRASLNVLMAIGWSIESVDGKIIAGFCEACGVLVLKGDNYIEPDPSGVYLCALCREQQRLDSTER